jgi:hypothetical protein
MSCRPQFFYEKDIKLPDMKNKGDIEQQAEMIISSLDGIQRAETKPFFYTRLMARMEGGSANVWSRWMAFLAKPAVSLALLLVFLLINGYLIFSKLQTRQDISAPGYDYAVTQISYLDANPE